MEYIDEILKNYPDPMSKKQFREVSCISNTTATFLLESGFVPSRRVGKAKFFYEIRKSDVAAYLRRREKQPSAYTPPKRWYRTHPERQPPAFSLLRSLDYTRLDRTRVRVWYGRKLCRWPDLLRTEEISQITGYHPHSVSRWCTEKTIPSISVKRFLYVPKNYLLDFLSSDAYNSIRRKSRQHYDDIRQITAELSKEKKPGHRGLSLAAEQMGFSRGLKNACFRHFLPAAAGRPVLILTALLPQKNTSLRWCFLVAEQQGFEPWRRC